MKITIELNQELGEARLTKASKLLLEALLREDMERGYFDVELADFLTDAKLIIDNAYQAAMDLQPTFKEGV